MALVRGLQIDVVLLGPRNHRIHFRFLVEHPEMARGDARGQPEYAGIPTVPFELRLVVVLPRDPHNGWLLLGSRRRCTFPGGDGGVDLLDGLVLVEQRLPW